MDTLVFCLGIFSLAVMSFSTNPYIEYAGLIGFLCFFIYGWLRIVSRSNNAMQRTASPQGGARKRKTGAARRH